MRPDYRRLGKAIADARETNAISAMELAQKLELSPSFVCDVEKGRTRPSEKTLGLFAKALDLDREELAAVAGILGETAEKYLRETPEAVALIRLMAKRRTGIDQIAKIQRLL